MMQYRITDSEAFFAIQFIDGNPQPVEALDKALEKPDIQYTLTSATLQAMSSGKINGLQAYQQGKLKVQASFSDLMKLQSLNRL